VVERIIVKKCDIIIPVWNGLEYTKNCIKKLKECTAYPYRIIVIDNASERSTEEYLENLSQTFPDLILIRNNVNLGFVKAINQGMAASSGEYVCLLNNDTLATKGWLGDMVKVAEIPEENIGIVSPASNVFGVNSRDGKAGDWQEIDGGRGFCMLIKREVIEKVGFFDEIFGLGYFEEKDFSRRAFRAGYISARAKASFVYHEDKVSFDRMHNRDDIFKRNEEIFNERWGRSLSLAYLAREKDKLEKKRGEIYSLLDKGHRINLFYTRKSDREVLKDHINIKYFKLRPIFFGYATLFKMWKRSKKKGMDFIITDDRRLFDFFKRHKFLHKAEVRSEGVL